MSKAANYDYTSNQRKRSERARLKEAGFVRRDVWAHPEDWDRIRQLEKELMEARRNNS